MKNYWLDRRKRAGFPQDDALSLQQFTSGDANLDLYYHLQFVQNEWLKNEPEDHPCTTNCRFKQLPVSQTMTGTIYLEGKPIQTFVHWRNGIKLTEYAPSKARVFYAELKDDGKLFFEWVYRTTEEYKVVASYEYSLDMWPAL